MKWYLKVLRQYADFSGKSSRKEFWMFFLFNLLFSWAYITIVVFCKNNKQPESIKRDSGCFCSVLYLSYYFHHLFS